MAQILFALKDRVLSVIRREEGADAVEYLLTIAVISVAVVLAIATNVWTPLVTAVVTGVCAAIATLPGMGAVAC